MRYIICFFIIIFLYSCAIKVAPEGGTKDIKPPEIIETDPPNQSTSIMPSDIRITFNEYIALKDLSTQLVSSPLLKYIPLTKVRKKNLYIHLADTLAANTTYTLNFGNSITDNNEGNVMEDYQYVFSTGEVIDSLIIKGKVQNAFDHTTAKDILVLIYKNYTDSVPFLQRPLYAGKTNTEGNFIIRNIAPGNYKIIALKEADGNYLYAGSGEGFAFDDSLVTAGSENVSLLMFQENPLPHFSKSVSEFAGKFMLVFTAAADTVQLHWLSDTASLKIHSVDFSLAKDTISYWYKNTGSDSISFWYFNGKQNDTVVSRLFKNDTDRKKEKFRLNVTAENPAFLIQDYFEPLKLIANHPLLNADTSLFILREDSLQVHGFTAAFSDSLRLKINIGYHWKSKMKYSLTILPGGLNDIYGLKNDTAKIEFPAHAVEDYGTLRVKFTAAESNYIIQLLNPAEAVIRESYVRGDSVLDYKNLLPNSYRLKIIYDANGNHKWDSGNYLRHLQPEKISYYQSTITVRSNWDVEVKWNESDTAPSTQK